MPARFTPGERVLSGFDDQLPVRREAAATAG
jgi:hypothetical protein